MLAMWPSLSEVVETTILLHHLYKFFPLILVALSALFGVLKEVFAREDKEIVVLVKGTMLSLFLLIVSIFAGFLSFSSLLSFSPGFLSFLWMIVE